MAKLIKSKRATAIFAAILAAVLLATVLAAVMVQRSVTIHHSTMPRIMELWDLGKTEQLTTLNYTFWQDQVGGYTNGTVFYIYDNDLDPDKDLKVSVAPDSSFNATKWNLWIWSNGPTLPDTDLYIKTSTNNTGKTGLYGLVEGGNVKGSWLSIHLFYWLKDGQTPNTDIDFQLIFTADVGPFI
jgi:hypothetical protein